MSPALTLCRGKAAEQGEPAEQPGCVQRLCILGFKGKDVEREKFILR